jgi:hypothetical protein
MELEGRNLPPVPVDASIVDALSTMRRVYALSGISRNRDRQFIYWIEKKKRYDF